MPFGLAGVVAVLVLAAPRRVWWQFAAAGALGLVLVGVFIAAGGAVYTDPRPFVVNPAQHPLFGHAPDNAFPSDHSVAAGLLTVLAWRLRAAAGAVVAVGAVLVAAARVAAHVHHAQDVVAGLALGAVAGMTALTAVRVLHDRPDQQHRRPQQPRNHRLRRSAISDGRRAEQAPFHRPGRSPPAP